MSLVEALESQAAWAPFVVQDDPGLEVLLPPQARSTTQGLYRSGAQTQGLVVCYGSTLPSLPSENTSCPPNVWRSNG